MRQQNVSSTKPASVKTQEITGLIVPLKSLLEDKIIIFLENYINVTVKRIEIADILYFLS